MERICRVWVVSFLCVAFMIKAVAGNAYDLSMIPTGRLMLENPKAPTGSQYMSDIRLMLDDMTMPAIFDSELFTGGFAEETGHDGIGEGYDFGTYDDNLLEFQIRDPENEDVFHDGFTTVSSLQEKAIEGDMASLATAGQRHPDGWMWRHANDPGAGANVSPGPRLLSLLALGLIGCFVIVRRRLTHS